MPATPIDILGLTGPELFAAAKDQLSSGAGAARAIYESALLKGRFAPAEHGLNSESVRAWTEQFCLRLPEVVDREEEQTPAGHTTTKLALELRDGSRIECVKIPMRRGRLTLCVSSQVGCRLGCRFCETAQNGWRRNLTSAEIIGQVVVARAVMGWPIESVVFMGMGEPLDNTEAVIGALRVLNDEHGLNYARRRLTVCTAGLPEGIRRLGELGWRRLGLAISLNSANGATRSELMPIGRKVTLPDLQAALLAYPRRGSFVLGLNYCLLPGINDSEEAAQEVARFVAPLGRVLVNVIPYNPGSAPIAPASSDQQAEAFARRLQRLGLAANQRATKGRGVMAACGQLGGAVHGIKTAP